MKIKDKIFYFIFQNYIDQLACVAALRKESLQEVYCFAIPAG
jgi:hypothetical protein